MNVDVDRGYGSETTRERLRARRLVPAISEWARPAPLGVTKRRVIERTNPCNNTHMKLLWCTERGGG